VPLVHAHVWYSIVEGRDEENRDPAGKKLMGPTSESGHAAPSQKSACRAPGCRLEETLSSFLEDSANVFLNYKTPLCVSNFVSNKNSIPK
jgi:hypothetical protein